MKRGRKYHGCVEEYNVGKRGKGKQYPLPYHMKVVNIEFIEYQVERGVGNGNLEKKIKIKKLRGRISSWREFFTTLLCLP